MFFDTFKDYNRQLSEEEYHKYDSSEFTQGYTTRSEVYNLDKKVQLPIELKRFSN